MSLSDLVRRLELLPHPEGGYYRETYRSAGRIPGDAFPGSRNYSTAIYFLLEAGQYSAFHRIASDECWHFYQGVPLYIYVIHPSGDRQTLLLGNDLSSGAVFQAVVPAGCWFASRPAVPEGYSLVGCTVAPGFDFADFEMAEKGALAAEYPQHAALIEALCR